MKLLLIGSNHIHLKNYAELIDGYFDKIYFITNSSPPVIPTETSNLNFSLKNPIQGWRTVSSIKKIIKSFKPDIVHVHQAGSFAFYALLAARGFKIPMIVTAWGSDILYIPKSNYLLGKMVKYILRTANYFTSDSVFMAEEMNRIASKKLNILIANFGIDIANSHSEKEDLIYSNRQLTPLYRIDKIIELFKKFISSDEKYKHWKLAIAATGNEEDSLRKQVKEAGIETNVQFHGWVDKADNVSLYGKAKIYISIPSSDATSISLLEALDAACIPVVSDLQANKEWIRDGVNGIIYKEGDENVFQKAININSSNAIKINREIIDKECTKPVNRQKFISLYESILNGA